MLDMAMLNKKSVGWVEVQNLAKTSIDAVEFCFWLPNLRFTNYIGVVKIRICILGVKLNWR
jgi:hypothetical protein